MVEPFHPHHPEAFPLPLSHSCPSPLKVRRIGVEAALAIHPEGLQWLLLELVGVPLAGLAVLGCAAFLKQPGLQFVQSHVLLGIGILDECPVRAESFLPIGRQVADGHLEH